METPAKSTASAKFLRQIVLLRSTGHSATNTHAASSVTANESAAGETLCQMHFYLFALLLLFFFFSHALLHAARFIGPHYLFLSLWRSLNVGRCAHAINFSKIRTLM